MCCVMTIPSEYFKGRSDRDIYCIFLRSAKRMNWGENFKFSLRSALPSLESALNGRFHTIFRLLSKEQIQSLPENVWRKKKKKKKIYHSHPSRSFGLHTRITKTDLCRLFLILQ